MIGLGPRTAPGPLPFCLSADWSVLAKSTLRVRVWCCCLSGEVCSLAAPPPLVRALALGVPLLFLGKSSRAVPGRPLPFQDGRTLLARFGWDRPPRPDWLPHVDCSWLLKPCFLRCPHGPVPQQFRLLAQSQPDAGLFVASPLATPATGMCRGPFAELSVVYVCTC